MQVITTKPVTLEGKPQPVGTTLDVSDDTGKWLIAEKAAKAADVESAKPPKAGTGK